MNRDFKGVWIPREIWLSENLTLQEKVFLAEIDSLDNEQGCFATNKYFAEFFSLTPSRCSQVISSLEKKEFINIKLIYGEKNNVEKRIIKVVNKLTTPIKNAKGGVKDTKPPYLENAQDNNTSTNNTINNTSNIYTLFNYWNESDIIKHRELTQSRKSRINARLKSYSLDELKQAIDNYKQVLDSHNYFFTHKWPLELFMQPKNLERFADESKLDSFLKIDYKKSNKGYVPMSERYDPAVDEF